MMTRLRNWTRNLFAADRPAGLIFGGLDPFEETA
jgi:hypothetical protein